MHRPTEPLYYMMNILDYLTGNIDRHWGNWGLLVDNFSHQPICVHNLMDFNQTFKAYDTIDGANCLITDRKRGVISQREAAEEAVRKIGWNQLKEIEKEWFFGRKQEYEMLLKRIDILKNIASK